jgi:Glyoxalase/Bleomycin resistance protein/Dioxygenase superfamily
MSRLFGPMRQVGIVVRDIEKAMRHWVEVCGIGPWFYTEQLPMDEFRYKGRIYDLKVSIALANSGDVQLELIQQRNDVPSLYRDFLVAGHEGMQHWSSLPLNYHEIRERALTSGWQIGQEGDTPRGGPAAFTAAPFCDQRRAPRRSLNRSL